MTAGYSLATGSCPIREWRVEWGSNVGCCCAASVRGHILSSRQAPRKAGGRLGAEVQAQGQGQRRWLQRRAWKLVASTIVPTLSGPLVVRSKVGTPCDCTSTATSGPVELERRGGGNWGMTWERLSMCARTFQPSRQTLDLLYNRQQRPSPSTCVHFAHSITSSHSHILLLPFSLCH